MTRRIIIDTDPGKDDAIAILLALASPELDVIALTAVHGNMPLAMTQRNARALLALAGRPDIPVHPGCSRPMTRAPTHAAHVHGPTGLGSLQLPAPLATAQYEDGVAFLIRTFRTQPPRTITLCLLGPATNLAIALVQAPDIASRIEAVVMMGGAIDGGGNITASAEFNVYADPEAARVVFDSGVPLTVIPLDLTHQIRLTPPVMRRLRTIPSACAQAVCDLFEADQAPAMHDPCVIARLLQRDLFDGDALSIAVETTGELTLGMTVADRRQSAKPANAFVLRRGDADPFFELLVARLSRLP